MKTKKVTYKPIYFLALSFVIPFTHFLFIKSELNSKTNPYVLILYWPTNPLNSVAFWKLPSSLEQGSTTSNWSLHHVYIFLSICHEVIVYWAPWKNHSGFGWIWNAVAFPFDFSHTHSFISELGITLVTHIPFDFVRILSPILHMFQLYVY